MTEGWSAPYAIAGDRRVDRRALRELLAAPGALIGSMRASWRYDPATFLQLPVRASWRSRIRRQPGARMELGGHLFLGHWPNEPDDGGDDDDEQDAAVAKPITAGPAVDARAVLELHRGARFTTGGWVVLGGGSEVVVAEDASLHLGGGFIGNAHVLIIATEAVHIGRDCAISWGAQILDSDLHVLSIAGDTRPQRSPIHIGDRVWVGTRATILKGVRVGNGAVIAAGAMVTSDVPERAVVGGVPAKVIATDAEWY